MMELLPLMARGNVGPWGALFSLLIILTVLIVNVIVPELKARAFRKRTETKRTISVEEVHRLNEAGKDASVCTVCHGGGETKEVDWRRSGRTTYTETYVTCGNCHGRGYIVTEPEVPAAGTPAGQEILPDPAPGVPLEPELPPDSENP
jgi:cytochrome c553